MNIRIYIISLFLGFISQNASAALVTYNFTAHITDIFTDYTLVETITGNGSTFSKGDLINGRVSYDSAVLGKQRNPDDPTYDFFDAVKYLSFTTASGFSFQQHDNGRLELADLTDRHYENPSPISSLSMHGFSRTLTANASSYESTELDLVDRSTNGFNIGSSLPIYGLDANTVTYRLFTYAYGSSSSSSVDWWSSFYFNSSVDSMSLESVTAVPIPAAIWFMGSALFGLFGVVRNKGSK